MILNTHPHDRKAMVGAISELTGVAAVYKNVPTFAYEIGPMTVGRDGTISCDDPAAIARIQPMLIGRGWLDAPPEDQEPEAPAPEAPVRTELTMPLAGWTALQLTNLLRLLYSRQQLINRMLQSDMLRVDARFIDELGENPLTGYDDFKARMLRAIEDGSVCGIGFEEDRFRLHAPHTHGDTLRLIACSELLGGILKLARETKHVQLKHRYDPENEKYHANMWLMRMGFAGEKHRETRRVLMSHLNGFAAFRNAAAMQRHREKYSPPKDDAVIREDAHD